MKWIVGYLAVRCIGWLGVSGRIGFDVLQCFDCCEPALPRWIGIGLGGDGCNARDVIIWK